MIIKKLALSNFRNYEKLDISLSPGINIFYGNNAQGKTNILESIYLCCTTKSHRGSKDREMIRFGQDDSHIRMFIENEGVTHKIDMHLKRGSSKGAAIDMIPVRRSGELFGLVKVVCFSPEDLSIIKNGPDKRRRFIDMELCQLDKIYLHDISSYNKVVNQRNNLLKQIYGGNGDLGLLDIFDEQMTAYGTRIIKRRRDFLSMLSNLTSPVHRSITGGKEDLKLIYDPCVDEDDFSEKLAKSRDRDIRMKVSQIGPHRDDFIFYTDDIDIRKYGSQGQQRSAALSLKLAEINMIKKITDNDPILLLDDVLSELDTHRQKCLLDSIKDIQAIVTCTGLDEFIENHVDADLIYEVENGSVKAYGSLLEV